MSHRPGDSLTTAEPLRTPPEFGDSPRKARSMPELNPRDFMSRCIAGHSHLHCVDSAPTTTSWVSLERLQWTRSSQLSLRFVVLLVQEWPAFHILLSQMSKQHHPDVPDHKLRPPFQEITAAYNVLRDPVSRRAYDNTLPTPAREAPASTLQSRHAADTAARLRRAAASRPAPAASQSQHPHTANVVDPSFPRRPPSQDPVPGALDRHNQHPGQRYVPPDPAAQTAAWAAQQQELRDQQGRSQRHLASAALAVWAKLSPWDGS
ncbi:hypothetical protein C8R43DRAFT_1210732 [Mycena crocata]|nr:hypothetical protein C8R43DRAFT_1210732 [Mycena crocata]